jgi:hypothetical protein
VARAPSTSPCRLSVDPARRSPRAGIATEPRQPVVVDHRSPMSWEATGLEVLRQPAPGREVHANARRSRRSALLGASPRSTRRASVYPCARDLNLGAHPGRLPAGAVVVAGRAGCVTDTPASQPTRPVRLRGCLTGWISPNAPGCQAPQTTRPRLGRGLT